MFSIQFWMLRESSSLVIIDRPADFDFPVLVAQDFFNLGVSLVPACRGDGGGQIFQSGMSLFG
jgi:hypothetical protein